MRQIIILLMSIFLFGCSNEKEDIINTFNEFNTANIELDGEKIYNLSDIKSRNYYKNFLSKILKLDSVGITQLQLSEKINLLSTRAIIEDSVLKTLSPKDLMIKIFTEISTMDTEQIRAIKTTGITNIKINNQNATGDFTIDGKTLSPNVTLKFVKDNGDWKFNVLSMSDYTERQLNAICQQNGFKHIDLIEWLFEATNFENKKIKELEDIWHPVVK
ncbi:hypothetical protein [Olleya sp. YS]|uniref:hypothetical protein n=1 Tax=Olleya sp. YS TaxID=3028318 RepID=UPI00243430FE|nr:hypothetical protein [Olleya sp. YS]WGD33982.1 hypothetical protein Ollyesu_09335 [Olleya sp. YS]